MKIGVSFCTSKQQWKADVPASIAGKRTREYFPEMAEMWAAQKAGDVRLVGIAAFVSSLTVNQAVERMMGRISGSSTAHQTTAKKRFGRFQETFGNRNLGQIHSTDLDQWLLQFPTPPRATVITVISRCFFDGRTGWS